MSPKDGWETYPAVYAIKATIISLKCLQQPEIGTTAAGFVLFVLRIIMSNEEEFSNSIRSTLCSNNLALALVYHIKFTPKWIFFGIGLVMRDGIGGIY